MKKYICPVCKKEFKDYEFEKRIYCSQGCNGKSKARANNPHWNGGKTIGEYITILNPDHPNSNKLGYVGETLLIAEKTLGKTIPKNSIIHHINHNKHDNRSENLVICQDSPYHSILHRRERAYKTCGHAHWRKCNYCKKYDDPEKLYISSNGVHYYHRICANRYQTQRKKMQTT